MRLEKWTQPRTKFFGVSLQKDMTEGDDGTLLVRGFFTSDNKDETGDIITRSATERAIPKYRQWGNIRYMHQPRPVAVVTGIGVEDGLAWNEVEIKVIDPQAVFEVKNRLLKALSVGILIKYEDVDFLEDGGLIINDYTLAEISLVDHPANYDAALRTSSVSDGIRTLARSFGMDAVAQSFQEILEKEIDAMKTNTLVAGDANEINKDIEPVEEQVKEQPEETSVEAVVETEVPAPNEEPAVEAPQDGDAPAEQPVDEDPAVSAEADAPAQEEDETKVLLRSMMDQLAALTEAVKALRPSQEAPAVEVQVEPKSVGGDDAVEKAVSGVSDEPQLGAPVNRGGGIPATELPDTASVEGTRRDYTLREALQKILEYRNQ